MGENKSQYLDRLRRAFDMEEMMAEAILSLITRELPATQLPESAKARIFECLEILGKDTARHKNTVAGLLAKEGAGDSRLEHIAKRLRQLNAVDANSIQVYSDLAAKSEDPSLKKLFLKIAEDEKRHEAMEMELLDLLEKGG